MPISEAQKRAADKYIKNTFDELKIRVPKGKKESIKDFAAQNGETLNAYINRLIREDMQR